MQYFFRLYIRLMPRRILLAALLWGFCTQSACAAPQSFACVDVKPQDSHIAEAQDFIYTSHNRDLYLHVFAPHQAYGKAASVVFYFGGGWRVGRIDQFQAQAMALVQRGIAAVLVDYRVTCRDDSTPLDSLADAREAYRWVRAHAEALNMDPARIALSGGSAGGQLALTIALTSAPSERPGAVVLFNPALVDFLAPPWSAFGLTPSEVATLSPDQLPIGSVPPLLIIHSKYDTTVPIGRIRSFCGRVLDADRACTLIEFPGLNHGFFNSRNFDPETGVVPLRDSTSKAIDFLTQLGWGPRIGTP